MNADDDRLARQLAALAARVTQLEAEVAQMRQSATPPVSTRASSGDAREEAAPNRATGLRVPSAVPRRDARPSLESRIGSQLFNRIGIIALLVGVAWFLKFAIDNHWIGPAARVLIGLGAGIGIIAGSEWFRKRNYKGFSYSLKALGTGILYLSLWAAYTLFGLIPAWTAFAAMVAVTAANAWLCWRQNSEAAALDLREPGAYSLQLSVAARSGRARTDRSAPLVTTAARRLCRNGGLFCRLVCAPLHPCQFRNDRIFRRSVLPAFLCRASSIAQLAAGQWDGKPDDGRSPGAPAVAAA
jgi:uncharacterized membrane protein